GIIHRQVGVAGRRGPLHPGRGRIVPIAVAIAIPVAITVPRRVGGLAIAAIAVDWGRLVVAPPFARIAQGRRLPIPIALADDRVPLVMSWAAFAVGALPVAVAVARQPLPHREPRLALGPLAQRLALGPFPLGPVAEIADRLAIRRALLPVRLPVFALAGSLDQGRRRLAQPAAEGRRPTGPGGRPIGLLPGGGRRR